MTIRGNPWILGIGAAVYIAGSLAFALTKAPLNDEGWFAAPAYNLAAHGSPGILALEPTGSWLSADLTGIRQHTYWNMPLSLAAQAAWLRLWGFGRLPLRMLSIVSGLAVLGAWFVIVLLLTEDRIAAHLGFLLLAIDYTFLWGAADGRPDMLCLALGSVGMASYLALRESRLTAAILVSNTFAAAAFFTHPNGLMTMASLGFLTLYFDARRLRVRHLAAALPYAAGTLCWLGYISQAPAQFLAQFAANSSARGGSRWAFLTAPWKSLYLELLGRHLAHFGFFPIWTDATSRWNVLIPVVYWIAAFSAALSGVFRRRGSRALLAILAIYFLMLTANGLKLQFYLVFLMPAYAAVLGMWVRYRLARPTVLFVFLAPFLCLQVASIIHLVRTDKYHKTYLPAMEYVRQNSGPATVVMANSTAAFALGYDHLVDDERLGYFSSVAPDLIVVDRYYPMFWRIFRAEQPDVWQYIRQQIESGYELGFQNEYYKVYRREGAARRRIRPDDREFMVRLGRSHVKQESPSVRRRRVTEAGLIFERAALRAAGEEEGPRRASAERGSHLDRYRNQSAVPIDVEQLPAVGAPRGVEAAAVRNASALRHGDNPSGLAAEWRYVDLLARRFVEPGCECDPAPIGREAARNGGLRVEFPHRKRLSPAHRRRPKLVEIVVGTHKTSEIPARTSPSETRRCRTRRWSLRRLPRWRRRAR